jgi:hypothetical protein
MTRLNKPNFKLNFSGWTDHWTGYGGANLNWIKILNKLTNGGVSLEWERKVVAMSNSKKDPYTKEEKLMIEKPFVKEKIGIIHSTPDYFHYITSDYRIGYTMTETSHIGKRWASLVNNMDRLFVPCNQLVDIFRKSGVTIPINVIPEGYDLINFIT